MSVIPTLDGLPVLLDATAPVTRRDRSGREVGGVLGGGEVMRLCFRASFATGDDLWPYVAAIALQCWWRRPEVRA